MVSHTCAVKKCRNNYKQTKKLGHEIHYHRFPKEVTLKNIWIKKCGRGENWNTADHARICSAHFKVEDYERDLRSELMGTNRKKWLKKSAVPSLNLGTVDNKNNFQEFQEHDLSISRVEVFGEFSYDLNISTEIVESPSIFHINDVCGNYVEETGNIEVSSKSTSNDGVTLKEAQNKILELSVLKKIADEKISELTNQKVELYKKCTTYQKEIAILKSKLNSVTKENLRNKGSLSYLKEELETLKSKKLKKFELCVRLRSCLKGILTESEISVLLDRKKKVKFDNQIINVAFILKYLRKRAYNFTRQSLMFPLQGLSTLRKWDMNLNFQPGFLEALCKMFKIAGAKIEPALKVAIVSFDEKEVKSYFEYDTKNDAVLVPCTFFLDALHLLKEVRNWLLDTGFTLANGAVPLCLLLKLKNGEFKLCPILSAAHLSCQRAERQNVVLAAQTLPYTVATALKRYTPGNSDAALNLVNFIDQINSWVHTMNSYIPDAKIPCKSGYGIYLPEQNLISDQCYSAVSGMQCTARNTLQVFHSGILMSINTVKPLYAEVNSSYGMSYILTQKLNHNVLENLFSKLITNKDLNDRPTSQQLLDRLRMIAPGRNIDLVQSNSSVSRDSGISGPHLHAAFDIDADETSLEMSNHDSVMESVLLSETEKDSMHYYIAGWIAHKHGDTNPDLGSSTFNPNQEHAYAVPSWVPQLACSGLREPTEKLMHLVAEMDKIFLAYNRIPFKKGENFMNGLVKVITGFFSETDVKIIKSFVRIRTFIRINNFNSKYEEQKQKQLSKRKRNFIDELDTSRKYLKKIF